MPGRLLRPTVDSCSVEGKAAICDGVEYTCDTCTQTNPAALICEYC